MTAYQFLRKNAELAELINSTNYRLNQIINYANGTENVNYGFCCHGKYHMEYVSQVAGHVLTILGYDEHTVMLAKIAGLLHDIGNVLGRHDHARIGGEMSIYFLDKTELLFEDKRLIRHAIADHGNGNNMNHPVGAAVLIGDKAVAIKQRDIEFRKDFFKRGLITEEQLNNPSTLDIDISHIEITVADNVMKFEYFADNMCKEAHEKWLRDINVLLLEKGAAFLGYKADFIMEIQQTTNKSLKI